MDLVRSSVGKILTKVLKSALSTVFDGVSSDKAGEDLEKGEVLLRNLTLKTELMPHALPMMSISHCSIGTMRLQLDWARLRHSPIVVTVSDVTFIMKTKEYDLLASTNGMSGAVEGKIQSLLNFFFRKSDIVAFLIRLLSSNNVGAEVNERVSSVDDEDTFLLLQVLNRIEMTLTNATVVIEDELGPNGQPSSLVAILPILRLSTLPPEDVTQHKKNSLYEGESVKKNISIEGLTAGWVPYLFSSRMGLDKTKKEDPQPTSQSPDSSDSPRLPTPVDCLPLLAPTAISLTISFHHTCLGAPDTKLSVAMSIGKLNLSLGADVINMLMHMIDCFMGVNDDYRSLLDFAEHLANLPSNKPKKDSIPLCVAPLQQYYLGIQKRKPTAKERWNAVLTHVSKAIRYRHRRHTPEFLTERRKERLEYQYYRESQIKGGFVVDESMHILSTKEVKKMAEKKAEKEKKKEEDLQEEKKKQEKKEQKRTEKEEKERQKELEKLEKIRKKQEKEAEKAREKELKKMKKAGIPIPANHPLLASPMTAKPAAAVPQQEQPAPITPNATPAPQSSPDASPVPNASPTDEQAETKEQALRKSSVKRMEAIEKANSLDDILLWRYNCDEGLRKSKNKDDQFVMNTTQKRYREAQKMKGGFTFMGLISEDLIPKSLKPIILGFFGYDDYTEKIKRRKEEKKKKELRLAEKRSKKLEKWGVNAFGDVSATASGTMSGGMEGAAENDEVMEGYSTDAPEIVTVSLTVEGVTVTLLGHRKNNRPYVLPPKMDKLEYAQFSATMPQSEILAKTNELFKNLHAGIVYPKALFSLSLQTIKLALLVKNSRDGLFAAPLADSEFKDGEQAQSKSASESGKANVAKQTGGFANPTLANSLFNGSIPSLHVHFGVEKLDMIDYTTDNHLPIFVPTSKTKPALFLHANVYPFGVDEPEVRNGQRVTDRVYHPSFITVQLNFTIIAPVALALNIIPVVMSFLPPVMALGGKAGNMGIPIDSLITSDLGGELVNTVVSEFADLPFSVHVKLCDIGVPATMTQPAKDSDIAGLVVRPGRLVLFLNSSQDTMKIADNMSPNKHDRHALPNKSDTQLLTVQLTGTSIVTTSQFSAWVRREDENAVPTSSFIDPISVLLSLIIHSTSYEEELRSETAAKNALAMAKMRALEDANEDEKEVEENDDDESDAEDENEDSDDDENLDITRLLAVKDRTSVPYYWPLSHAFDTAAPPTTLDAIRNELMNEYSATTTLRVDVSEVFVNITEGVLRDLMTILVPLLKEALPKIPVILKAVEESGLAGPADKDQEKDKKELSRQLKREEEEKNLNTFTARKRLLPFFVPSLALEAHLPQLALRIDSVSRGIAKSGRSAKTSKTLITASLSDVCASVAIRPNDIGLMVKTGAIVIEDVSEAEKSVLLSTDSAMKEALINTSFPSFIYNDGAWKDTEATTGSMLTGVRIAPVLRLLQVIQNEDPFVTATADSNPSLLLSLSMFMPRGYTDPAPKGMRMDDASLTVKQAMEGLKPGKNEKAIKESPLDKKMLKKAEDSEYKKNHNDRTVIEVDAKIKGMGLNLKHSTYIKLIQTVLHVVNFVIPQMGEIMPLLNDLTPKTEVKRIVKTDEIVNSVLSPPMGNSFLSLNVDLGSTILALERENQPIGSLFIGAVNAAVALTPVQTAVTASIGSLEVFNPAAFPKTTQDESAVISPFPQIIHFGGDDRQSPAAALDFVIVDGHFVDICDGFNLICLAQVGEFQLFVIRSFVEELANFFILFNVPEMPTLVVPDDLINISLELEAPTEVPMLAPYFDVTMQAPAIFIPQSAYNATHFLCVKVGELAMKTALDQKMYKIDKSAVIKPHQLGNVLKDAQQGLSDLAGEGKEVILINDQYNLHIILSQFSIYIGSLTPDDDNHFPLLQDLEHPSFSGQTSFFSDTASESVESIRAQTVGVRTKNLDHCFPAISDIQIRVTLTVCLRSALFTALQSTITSLNQGSQAAAALSFGVQSLPPTMTLGISTSAIEIAADGYLIETVNSILSSNVSEFPEHSFAFFRHRMKSDSSSAVTTAPSHESASAPSKPAEEIVVPSINETVENVMSEAEKQINAFIGKLTTLGRKAIAAKREGNDKLLPAADLTKLDDAAFDRFLAGSRPLLLFSVNVSSVSVYLFATPHAELESTQKLSSLIPIRDPLMSMSIESIQVVSLILQRSEGLLLTIGVQSMTILDARTLPGDSHSMSGTQSISSGEWRPFTSFTTVLSLNPPTPPEGTVVKKPTHMVKNTAAPLITFDRLHDPSFKLQPPPLSVQILIEKSLAINVDVLMDSPQLQVNIPFVFDVVHTALAVVDPLLQAITKLTSMLTNYTEFITNPTTPENATATGMPKPCIVQFDEDEIFEGESVRVERQTVEVVPPPSSIDTETIADVAKQIVSQFNAPARISLAVKDITVHVIENAQINKSYALSISTSLGADIVLQPPMVVNHEKEKTAEHLAFLAGFSQLFPQFDLLCKTGHGIKGVQITRFREVKEDVAGALIVSQPHALISGLFTLQDPQILVSNPARLKLVREEGMNKELALSQNAFIAALFPNKYVPLYPLSYYDTSRCHRILAPTNISVSFSLRSAFDVNTSDNKHVILQDCTSDAPFISFSFSDGQKVYDTLELPEIPTLQAGQPQPAPTPYSLSWVDLRVDVENEMALKLNFTDIRLAFGVINAVLELVELLQPRLESLAETAAALQNVVGGPAVDEAAKPSTELPQSPVIQCPPMPHQEGQMTFDYSEVSRTAKILPIGGLDETTDEEGVTELATTAFVPISTNTDYKNGELVLPPLNKIKHVVLVSLVVSFPQGLSVEYISNIHHGYSPPLFRLAFYNLRVAFQASTLAHSNIPPTPPPSVGIVAEGDAAKEPPHPFSILAPIAEAMKEITKATGLSFSGGLFVKYFACVNAALRFDVFNPRLNLFEPLIDPFTMYLVLEPTLLPSVRASVTIPDSINLNVTREMIDTLISYVVDTLSSLGFLGVIVKLGQLNSGNASRIKQTGAGYQAEEAQNDFLEAIKDLPSLSEEHFGEDGTGGDTDSVSHATASTGLHLSTTSQVSRVTAANATKAKLDSAFVIRNHCGLGIKVFNQRNKQTIVIESGMDAPVIVQKASTLQTEIDEEMDFHTPTYKFDKAIVKLGVETVNLVLELDLCQNFESAYPIQVDNPLCTKQDQFPAGATVPPKISVLCQLHCFFEFGRRVLLITSPFCIRNSTAIPIQVSFVGTVSGQQKEAEKSSRSRSSKESAPPATSVNIVLHEQYIPPHGWYNVPLQLMDSSIQMTPSSGSKREGYAHLIHWKQSPPLLIQDLEERSGMYVVHTSESTPDDLLPQIQPSSGVLVYSAVVSVLEGDNLRSNEMFTSGTGMTFNLRKKKRRNDVHSQTLSNVMRHSAIASLRNSEYAGTDSETGSLHSAHLSQARDGTLISLSQLSSSGSGSWTDDDSDSFGLDFDFDDDLLEELDDVEDEEGTGKEKRGKRHCATVNTRSMHTVVLTFKPSIIMKNSLPQTTHIQFDKSPLPGKWEVHTQLSLHPARTIKLYHVPVYSELSFRLSLTPFAESKVLSGNESQPFAVRQNRILVPLHAISFDGSVPNPPLSSTVEFKQESSALLARFTSQKECITIVDISVPFWFVNRLPFPLHVKQDGIPKNAIDVPSHPGLATPENPIDENIDPVFFCPQAGPKRQLTSSAEFDNSHVTLSCAHDSPISTAPIPIGRAITAQTATLVKDNKACDVAMWMEEGKKEFLNSTVVTVSPLFFVQNCVHNRFLHVRQFVVAGISNLHTDKHVDNTYSPMNDPLPFFHSSDAEVCKRSFKRIDQNKPLSKSDKEELDETRIVQFALGTKEDDDPNSLVWSSPINAKAVGNTPLFLCDPAHPTIPHAVEITVAAGRNSNGLVHNGTMFICVNSISLTHVTTWIINRTPFSVVLSQKDVKRTRIQIPPLSQVPFAWFAPTKPKKAEMQLVSTGRQIFAEPKEGEADVVFLSDFEKVTMDKMKNKKMTMKLIPDKATATRGTKTHKTTIFARTYHFQQAMCVDIATFNITPDMEGGFLSKYNINQDSDTFLPSHKLTLLQPSNATPLRSQQEYTSLTHSTLHASSLTSRPAEMEVNLMASLNGICVSYVMSGTATRSPAELTTISIEEIGLDFFEGATYQKISASVKEIQLDNDQRLPMYPVVLGRTGTSYVDNNGKQTSYPEAQPVASVWLTRTLLDDPSVVYVSEFGTLVHQLELLAEEKFVMSLMRVVASFDFKAVERVMKEKEIEEMKKAKVKQKKQHGSTLSADIPTSGFSSPFPSEHPTPDPSQAPPPPAIIGLQPFPAAGSPQIAESVSLVLPHPLIPATIGLTPERDLVFYFEDFAIQPICVVATINLMQGSYSESDDYDDLTSSSKVKEQRKDRKEKKKEKDGGKKSKGFDEKTENVMMKNLIGKISSIVGFPGLVDIVSALVNIEEKEMHFSGFFATNLTASMPQLVSSIGSHFKSQLIQNIVMLSISLSIIGDPGGLLTNMKQDVKQMYYDPKDGVNKGTRGGLSGIGRGVAGLLKHSTVGVLGSVGKATNAASSMIAGLSFNDDYKEKRAKEMAKGQRHHGQSLARGFKAFGKGIATGLTGVFVDPVRGAQRDGAKGFFKGIGQGLVGTVVKPVVGTVDLATKTIDEVKYATTVFDQKRRGRVRAPRWIGRTTGMKPYDLKEARGALYLAKAKRVSYDEEYICHVRMRTTTMRKVESILLLTNLRLMNLHTSEQGDRTVLSQWCVNLNTVSNAFFDPKKKVFTVVVVVNKEKNKTKNETESFEDEAGLAEFVQAVLDAIPKK
ncbi:putative Vacuolar protein sorting-associated protein 13C [Blattamonas nauphoetae]|uniref:Vacuolar protein sorting-associated protein 13C n=1 Tax=Blattamonas nauphoetae TaxID=2049346 RepID=A0ABQ9XHT5_9EUKA|nr:putative Vacuolar protein sorting-associated protein 13C [Blattamonas nauphoetae]